MDKETTDYIDKNYGALNHRFDSMMDSFRNQTKMIEGTHTSLKGEIGLLTGEIIDLRHDLKLKYGFIEADSKRIRDSIKSNHEETNQKLDELKKLIESQFN